MKISQIKRVSLSEQAMNIIKAKIICADFKSGEKLRVDILAEKLDISRTPVRDALKALVEQGLVMYNGIHYEVYAPTIEDLENLFSIRGCLESFAVKHAVKKITASKQTELQQMRSEGNRLVESNQKESFLEYDRNLHDWIIRVAENQKLESIIKGIQDQCWLIRNNFFRQYDPNIETAAMQEHIHIINLMLNGEASAAGSAMEEHLLNSAQRMKSAFLIKK
ncbi:GntR family transcriptional regulator [Treponema sp. OMZ 840]|uniref:GntR family transcriptional regulator n=1 Tax=Treponema sp. OMZ 840 TaxID=244313 RepID=UPI003D8B19CF